MAGAALPVPKGKSLGDSILLWFILLLLVVSLVMCGFLLIRMAGPKTLRSFGMITRVMVQVGLLPKEVLASAAPITGTVGQGARLARRPPAQRSQNADADPTRAAAVCTPDDPVMAAQPGDLSLLDPLAAFDMAAGRAAEARGLATVNPMPVPTAAGTEFLSASAAGSLPPPAPVQPTAATAAAGGTPPAAATPPAALPEIPVRALPAPVGKPQVIYSVELGFFLSAEIAQSYAQELQKRGIDVALVTQPDAGGRTWTYVRAGRFPDGAQALAYAQDLEARQRLPGMVVMEKQETPK